MKKLAALTCSLALIVCALLTTGCSWYEVGTAEFVERPATTYTQATTTDLKLIKFKVKTNKNEEFSVEGTEASQAGIKVEINGFDVTSVGSRTATVKLTAGDVKYTLTFDYSVYARDAKFAGGTGISTNPYLVGTYEQFDNMLQESLNEDHAVYFKLISDIDFTGKQIKQYAPANSKASLWLCANIDGNSYSLKNVKTVVASQENGDDYKYDVKRNDIFGTVKDFTLKNITVNFVSTGSNAAAGLVTTGTPGTTVRFENVTTTGFIDPAMNGATSVAAFVGQTGRMGVHRSVFVNCSNCANIVNSLSAKFVAGFTNTQNNSEISFENCRNEGNLEGAYSAVAGFVIRYNYTTDVSLKNCANTGTIYAPTDGASQSVAYWKSGASESGYDLYPDLFPDNNTKIGKLESLLAEKADERSVKVNLKNYQDKENYKVRFVITGHVGYTETVTTSGGVLQFSEDVPMENLTLSSSGEYVYTGPKLVGDKFEGSDTIVKPYKTVPAGYEANFNDSRIYGRTVAGVREFIVVSSAYPWVSEGTYTIYVYVLDETGKPVASSINGIATLEI